MVGGSLAERDRFLCRVCKVGCRFQWRVLGELGVGPRSSCWGMERERGGSFSGSL